MKVFSEEEKEKIIELVETYGDNDFNQIAGFMPGRSAKKIKEEYVNYLKLDIQDTSWSSEEDELLIKCQQQLGSKWDIISRHFPNKSIVSIKNRFHKISKNVQCCREQNPIESVIPAQSQQIPQQTENQQLTSSFSLTETGTNVKNSGIAQNAHQDAQISMGVRLDDHDTNKLVEGETLNGIIVRVSDKMNGYRITKILGSGCSCVVALVEKVNSSELYCAKIMPLNDENRKEQLKKVYKEIGFLKFLHHDNIIKCYDHFLTDDEKYIVIITDYCEQDLFDYIFKNQNNPYNLKEIILGIVSAVQYLHHNHIVHYDIKPENILIKNGKAILCDFGFAQFHCHNTISIIHHTTANFGGPEYFNFQPICAFKSDIYSLGITFYVIATHDGNVYDTNEFTIMSRALYEELIIDESDELQQLAKWCAAKDSNDRPTIDQVRGHNFFQH